MTPHSLHVRALYWVQIFYGEHNNGRNPRATISRRRLARHREQ